MNLLKKITIVLILVGVWQPADAQLLKKIGERAGKAAERTILNKTDQKVSQKIGKGIDDVVDGKQLNMGNKFLAKMGTFRFRAIPTSLHTCTK